MENKSKQKVYVQPEISKVRLTPADAVLGACKDGNDNFLACGSTCSGDEGGS
ncbi:MAG TPA: hypothetical protein PLM06_09770 [Anaerolineae bacterium]|nr:hypothetical protein [Anaerolineae bacterium]